MEEALGTAGTLALTAVVLVWGLWLAGGTGAWKGWRLVPVAVVPCVGTPLVLAGVLAERTLGDVANGTLFGFAVLVALGTLLRAARAPSAGDSPR